MHVGLYRNTPSWSPPVIRCPMNDKSEPKAVLKCQMTSVFTGLAY